MGVEVYRLRPQRTSEKDESSVAPVAGDQEQREIVLAEQSTEEVLPSVQNRKMTDIFDSISNMDLSALDEFSSDCTRCSLSGSRNRVVFGSGSENADLMFIGEGPGAEEDKQGLPFVGKAGNLLTSMIYALGYEREEVYICNVVKCRPPNNRDPSPVEAKSCTPYLQRQIELIQPKVIVALGRISAQLLLDTELPLARLRRQTYKFKETGIDLVVTYHPAYLLRKPTEKAKSWEDMWNVRLLLNQ